MDRKVKCEGLYDYYKMTDNIIFLVFFFQAKAKNYVKACKYLTFEGLSGCTEYECNLRDR